MKGNIEISGNSTVLTPTITVDTNIYASGDTIGGVLTLSNAVRGHKKTGFLHSILVVDKDAQDSALEILLFKSNPTAATTTDNAAFAFSTDDTELIAKIPVAAADYVDIDSTGIADLTNLGRLIQCDAASDGSLYAVIVSQGTPTYTAGTSLIVRFGFIQD